MFLRLSDASVICRTFIFQFSLLFFHVVSQAAAAVYVVSGFPNTGHRMLPKMWEVRSLYAAYIPGVELILTVKMETGHPVEGYFQVFW